MPTLKGRRFFFATQADLAPGLRAAEEAATVEYVLHETRDDTAFTILPALSDHAGLGHTTGHDINTSPIYLIFRRGKVPAAPSIRQADGRVRHAIDPTSDCLILRCGGLHAATGALLAGELQQPLDPSRDAIELFDVFSRKLFRGFTRVRSYGVGPEALERFRAGQRLATIGVKSPREYDLTDPSK